MSRVKTIAGVLVGVLLLAAVAALVFQARNQKTVTANFQRVTGLYSGSAVRMLGIQIGKVQDVEPMGQYVQVKLTYNGKYRIPANASAAIIPPSLIADRYVQFTPVYRGGPILKDGATIPLTGRGQLERRALAAGDRGRGQLAGKRDADPQHRHGPVEVAHDPRRQQGRPRRHHQQP
jgi:virulence factor Mce-like protein